MLNFSILHFVISSLSFTFAIENLYLNVVELFQGLPHIAIGKHLCGPATGKLYLQFLINWTVSLRMIAVFDPSEYYTSTKHSLLSLIMLQLFTADLTLRCCLANQRNVERCGGNCYLKGLAIATCCHHLCQWKHYISNPTFLP